MTISKVAGPNPVEIKLSKNQRKELEIIVSRRNSSQGLANRARIILLADKGKSNAFIAKKLDLNDDTVRLWRRRWSICERKIARIESDAFPQNGDIDKSCYKQFVLAIVEILKDASRSGAPTVFSAEQFGAIIAISCQQPSECGREVSHWTGRELADEAIKQGIVDSISASTVGRLLHENTIKPHLSRYWEYNERDKDPEAFDKKISEVSELYKSAAELHEHGTTVVSIDEKTGMQALEPNGPIKPCKPGHVEKREFEYTRHGTQVLTANFEVTTGKVISPTIEDTRKEDQFAAHIERTVNLHPNEEWIFICDQLNTHKSEALVKLIAKICPVGEDLMGVKGKFGILKSMETRKEFLENPSHRVRFVYLPKHTSWMNQVEMWFSMLSKRLLKRGVFKSKTDLKEKIQRFIKYFNETLAKPFKWNYSGKPLQA
ncbi:MAG: IS630 family transposase [Bacteroidota bacterium]|nr:IS630 family transposase [Bacteroidota bacterium]